MPSRQPVRKRSSSFLRAPPATSADDRRTAARISALLLSHAAGGVRLTVGSDDGESLALPTTLLDVLGAAAGMVANGASVAILARNDELSSQQAADVLNVSRQYMVRLLERGDIASTKVGSHRRVRAEDLAEYRRRRDEGRAGALAEMTDQSQANGGYDAPATFGPRRTA